MQDYASTFAAEDERLIYSRHITSENGIGDRALRKWIARGVFPPPDGNMHGRNFWRESTYRRWKSEVLAGKYRRPCRLHNLSKLAGATARAKRFRRNESL